MHLSFFTSSGIKSSAEKRKKKTFRQYKYSVHIKYCTSLIDPYKGYNPLMRGNINSPVWFQQQAHMKPCCCIVLRHKGNGFASPFLGKTASPLKTKNHVQKDEDIKVFISNKNTG